MTNASISALTELNQQLKRGYLKKKNEKDKRRTEYVENFVEWPLPEAFPRHEGLGLGSALSPIPGSSEALDTLQWKSMQKLEQEKWLQACDEQYSDGVAGVSSDPHPVVPSNFAWTVGAVDEGRSDTHLQKKDLTVCCGVLMLQTRN